MQESRETDGRPDIPIPRKVKEQIREMPYAMPYAMPKMLDMLACSRQIPGPKRIKKRNRAGMFETATQNRDALKFIIRYPHL